MAFNVNPFSWKAFNLSIRNKAFDEAMREFQKQVTDFCTQVQALFSPAALSSILNGNAKLLGSAISTKIADLGVVTTNQSVNTAGAAFIYVRMSSAVTQTRTLTLTNLAQGVAVQVVAVVTANTLTLKMAATDTSGNTYTISGVATTNGAITNFVTTGAGQSSGAIMFLGLTGFIGSSATPDLTGLFI